MCAELREHVSWLHPKWLAEPLTMSPPRMAWSCSGLTAGSDPCRPMIERSVRIRRARRGRRSRPSHPPIPEPSPPLQTREYAADRRATTQAPGDSVNQCLFEHSHGPCPFHCHVCSCRRSDARFRRRRSFSDRTCLPVISMARAHRTPRLAKVSPVPRRQRGRHDHTAEVAEPTAPACASRKSSRIVQRPWNCTRFSASWPLRLKTQEASGSGRNG